MQPLIMVNPQWQGGGDAITYYGAKEFEKLYLYRKKYIEVTTALDTELLPEKGMIGYADIDKQMKSAFHLLKEHSFNKIFSVGGGCDADVPVIAYLNRRYNGSLLVLWLDAHGDLNAPEESQTGLFYGMPARILMDKGALFADIVERPLRAQQLIHIGGRDFDSSELRYIQANSICAFPSISIQDISHVINEKKGWPIYVHLDLDVLDPNEFANTPLPVQGGASKNEVLELLHMVKATNRLIGLGLYEYAPCGEKSVFIQNIMDVILR